MANTKVYYNSACPVCKAGVDRQQCTMTEAGVTNVEWLDVHQNPSLAADIGIDLEALRERLHVQQSDGSMHVGSDAFAALFANTPRQRWLGQLLKLPGTRWVAHCVYNLFARVLYRWNRSRGHW